MFLGLESKKLFFSLSFSSPTPLFFSCLYTLCVFGCQAAFESALGDTGDQDERKIGYCSDGILGLFPFPSLRVPIYVSQSLDALCALPSSEFHWHGLGQGWGLLAAPACSCSPHIRVNTVVCNTNPVWVGMAHQARFCGFLGCVSNVYHGIVECCLR